VVIVVVATSFIAVVIVIPGFLAGTITIITVMIVHPVDEATGQIQQRGGDQSNHGRSFE
jgi:hypothetical protein